MKGDLIINGADAFTTWGVSMGEGFCESLCTPAPLKEFVENKSRQEHGKRVIYNNARLDEREVSLVFYIEGSSKPDYLSKMKAFKNELAKGYMKISVPQLGSEIYHLTYLKSASFAMNQEQTFSKLSVKFNEPNPANNSAV